MTQNRQRIVNSDQMVNIFINNTGTTIISQSATSNFNELVNLGEYKDRDTCLKVMDMLLARIMGECNTFVMPLGGEV